ncbi:MAG: Xaa-Pro aminopeptidase [Bacteroidetes bacterium GWF2_38_335]|nr:MAG: Xaa-Pro aminopeptidase [Bacteroidetes bacterium GWF2_38_335]OFY79348.1 MAG: Xaa-Pro aminopeptidase [Bacteroidetes bacterium RIFOXYA12_FULL_38_20]HBS85608.1 Xaa-Pro aminopeptidase [Bacteroidales bacterium]
MFSKETYLKRRNALRAKFNDGLIVFLGNSDVPMNYPDNTYHFRQDSNFLYFFGVDLQGFAGIIDVESGKDIIFANDIDIEDVIWMGPQPSVKDLAALAAVEHSFPFSELGKLIKDAQSKGRKIHFTPPYRAENKILLEQLTGIHTSKLKESSSVELIKAIVSLRSIKEPQEIAHLEEIMDIAYEMHTNGMQMAHEGVYEREIAGLMEGIALSHGGMVSFPVILSKRGETLHNHYHGNLLKNGDLVIMDAGFESPLHYATDHTRTVPVGGKFSQKQKDIYQIVLDANNMATTLIKPGVTYRSIHDSATRIIAKGLIDLGLMKGNVEDAVNAGAHALFMPHGLGHMMGLDVHDMEDIGQIYVGYDDEIRPATQFGTAYLRMGRRLQPGFVITNEPGIYFIPALIDKWQNEKINNQFINFDKVREFIGFGGIRLEDDILVTETGSRNLGAKRIPITIQDVEAEVQKNTGI